MKLGTAFFSVLVCVRGGVLGFKLVEHRCVLPQKKFTLFYVFGCFACAPCVCMVPLGLKNY